MEEEDKEFFILVLGVLAAILLVISWWFTTGGTTVATTTATTETAAPAEEPVVEEPVVEEPVVEEPVVEEPAAEAPVPNTVFDVIAADSDLNLLNGLLRNSALDQVLSGDGPFTVFAPSNDGVNLAVSSDTTVAVMTADQASVLTYHVVPGVYTLVDLAEIAGSESNELTTVQGETIAVTLESGTVLINGSASVGLISEEAGNGVVHTLDNVLVPPVAALNALVGFEPILFASGSADIQADSFATLDGLIEILSASNVDVNIEGHTDSSGDPILNQNLSQSRARSVLNYLVASGIDEARLGAEGFGPDRPVADNETEEGRALNRRIEFTVG